MRTYDTQQLKTFEANKRYALAAAFLYATRKRLLDYLVEMHAQFMTEIQREARNAWEEEHRQVRKRLRRGMISLRERAETVLALEASLDAPFSATVDFHLIAEQWEGLVRVAASLKNRVVSANVIARRLASNASSNRLAKALLHLVRLMRTIYLLRYFHDSALRQQVRTQLNRGEARQDLAQRLFFADQGMFRSGDYYQMMNRARCLSLSRTRCWCTTPFVLPACSNARKLRAGSFGPKRLPTSRLWRAAM